MMHKTHDIASKIFKNKFIRVALGGAIIVLLTLLVGNQNYNGAGLHVISAALLGEAVPWAFAMKMLFTAITLGFGFKGGEIFPSFFIGATLACTVSGLIGFDPALGAAFGMICMFCCVTNAPIASLVMSVELFGSEYFFPFAILCAIGYALSGNFSLYDSQKILYSKLDGAERDVNTIENAENNN
jgi:H+/Cl- antiporter ClcA